MSVVEVRVVAHLIDVFGKKKFDYEFDGELDIYELLDRLDEQSGLGKYIYNSDKSITTDVRVMIMGRDIRFLGADSLKLKDGDIVLLLPTLAGG